MYTVFYRVIFTIIFIGSSISVATAEEIMTTSSAKFATVATTTTTITTTLPVTSATPTPAVIETAVRKYFADIPVMISIAKCESNFRQYTDAGNVFYNSNRTMVGVFQFDVFVHTKSALAAGFDITTLEGNLGYARQLYQQSGVTPWQSCVPVSTANGSEEYNQLRIALMTKLIDLLQQLLVLKLAGK